MDRYLELLEVDATTFKSYGGHVRNHIRPLLGKLPLSKLGAETLDSFYSIFDGEAAGAAGLRVQDHRTAGFEAEVVSAIAVARLDPAASTPWRWLRAA